MQAVLDTIDAAGTELSAPDIAAALDVSRATAQRYLGSLAVEKLIEVQLKYGSTGRQSIGTPRPAAESCRIRLVAAGFRSAEQHAHPMCGSRSG